MTHHLSHTEERSQATTVGVLNTRTPFEDLGRDWYVHLGGPQRRINDLIRQLEALGQTVTITPAA